MTSGIILISVLVPRESYLYEPYCFRFWAQGSPPTGEYPSPEWEKPTPRTGGEGYSWKSG